MNTRPAESVVSWAFLSHEVSKAAAWQRCILLHADANPLLFRTLRFVREV
jgi:hypothetical protein